MQNASDNHPSSASVDTAGAVGVNLREKGAELGTETALNENVSGASHSQILLTFSD